MPRKSKNSIKKFLKNPEVRRILIKTAGENTISVLQELLKTGEDEKIAEKLNVKVSDVRSVLNLLHNEGFVTYERTKDENTGWFYYRWNIDHEKMEKWINEKLKEKEKLYYEILSSGEKYFCDNCGFDNIYEFEEAMDLNFKCPVCNKNMEFLDENKLKSFIKNVN